MVRRIVILGPESTGKSTLCEQLAAHYNTLWVPEFAREYLLKNGPSYTYDDLLIIARRQLALEDEMAASLHRPLLFVDTDMYVMKIWCEFVFGRCHQWILDRIIERTYSLYLLCNIDLPWVRDELREYPDLEPRTRLFNIYRDNMINQHVPWKLISGNNEERFQTAVTAVNRLLVHY
ncbi:MAG: ATP-binding protein [Chitinophagaceae bacterium]|nr:ATP-binding protein [Chitinophagaceae bacterium]